MPAAAMRWAACWRCRWPTRSSRPSAGRVARTLDRSDKWLAQTPQMFRLGTAAAMRWRRPGLASPTRPARWRRRPRAAAGARRAGQLQGDVAAELSLAERLLAARGPESRRNRSPSLRIGEGWDTHALVPGRPLILGGVTIPHSHGLLGHSDADALLHAITDALFGAAALGDIGRHFPDTDARLQGRRLGGAAGAKPRAACVPRAATSSTSTAPSSRRRRRWRRTSRPCAQRWPMRWPRRRLCQRQGQDGREDGPGGPGPRHRGACGLPAASLP